MKIRTRDFKLLAIGFFIGVLVSLVFTTVSTRTVNTPDAGVMSAGPVLALASRPQQFTFSTNVQWEVQPIPSESQFIDNFDSQGPLIDPLQWRVDLIDTRYQPDIKLEDLK